MIQLGKLKTVSSETTIEIPTKDFKIGLNNTENHIIKVDSNLEIDYVIDKICNHAGGKLILKGEQAVCPMHDWKLNLENLCYNDSHISKEKVEFQKLENGNISLKDAIKRLENPFFNPNKKKSVAVRWINHATVYIECNGISLITDPWLFGPAFMTGWWLKSPSPTDSIALLKNADYVYISHNHPDHLHPETLALLKKDTKIIVGNFTSRSCEKYLKSLAFTNVSALDFNQIYELTPDFQISILKSGDFRDDSGIYINANNNQLLLTVDCNFLNSHVLPMHVDLLMTSFASGASGFPLCFDDYSLAEKRKISKRKKVSMRAAVVNYLQHTQPKYYIPYAGMFKEYSERDAFIRTHNLKNSPDDFKGISVAQNVNFIEAQSDVLLTLQNGHIHQNKLPKVTYLEKEDPNFYINAYKKEYLFSAEKTIHYLKNSGFKDKQIVQLIPTNSTFDKTESEIIYADFHQQIFKTISESELISFKEDYKVMKLSVRSEVIACVIENKLPWEDFSIGFQMRVLRNPNQYESKFWYHFTNIYTSEENFRYSPYCGSCTIIEQNPIWNKIK
ncbi:MBL fold metallo-hydrolase [Flavicella sediminum]|uniref:MBL fold metallo-hydrolase n=1 Tax=Flavicella sediminum TaxID=2585141 RepID=UPI00111D700C|nr:MBL fold metallo-hydrolase [Flavicella sediminum]